MEFWRKALISFSAILLSLSIFYLAQVNFFPLTPTGNFILTLGSISGIIIGISSIFLIIYQLTREERSKKEGKLNVDYIDKALGRKLYDIDPTKTEKIFIFELGNIASYFKKRTFEASVLGKSGVYKVYEILFEGAKRRIRRIFEENPEIIEKNYTLSLIYKTPLTYADKLLELLAHTSEVYKKFGMNYVDTKGLKRLASIIKKYAC